ncbi:MAG: alcohol dehydrogenase catalytic domain-containing protein [Flavobacteriales bacterium AspAUS03]
MKAIINLGAKDYVFEEVPISKIGEDEILIRVEVCRICSRDVKYWDGGAIFWGGKDGQSKYLKEPVIPGHEFVGHVVELGKNVTSY